MALTRLKTATLLAGLAGAIGAPGVAQAQFYFDAWGGRYDAPLSRDDGRDYDRPYRSYDRAYREERPFREAQPISRGEIAAMLSRRGLRVSPSMARNDDVYLVDAVDPSGRRLRLVVDAYDGTVLRRTEAGPPREVTRREDQDRWDDEDDFGAPPPPRGVEPRVIPGVGPAQRKPAPKKPATAKVEPRAPAPKPPTAAPAPTQAAPPPPAAASAPSAPAATAETRTSAPQAHAEAPPAAPATADLAPGTGPRVIPLYKTPSEGDGGKPAEGAP